MLSVELFSMGTNSLGTIAVGNVAMENRGNGCKGRGDSRSPARMKHTDRQALTVEQTDSRMTNGTWRIMSILLSCSSLALRPLSYFRP